MNCVWWGPAVTWCFTLAVLRCPGFVFCYSASHGYISSRRSYVIKPVTLYNLKQCSVIEHYKRFGGTYYLHLQRSFPPHGVISQKTPILIFTATKACSILIINIWMMLCSSINFCGKLPLHYHAVLMLAPGLWELVRACPLIRDL
jgi:hypothetical protein